MRPCLVCQGALMRAHQTPVQPGTGSNWARYWGNVNLQQHCVMSCAIPRLQLCALGRGLSCAGQGARRRRPRRGASKKRRGLAPKKRAPTCTPAWALCASGRPDTLAQKNNSQPGGCDRSILFQDPGSIPAPHTTFREIIKKMKKPEVNSQWQKVNSASKGKSQAGYNRRGCSSMI